MVIANTIALVANGAIDDYALIKPSILSHTYIVAVDGGLAHCDAMEITPHLLIGDLDSLSDDLKDKYAHIKTLKHSSDKDETDLELALKEFYNSRVNYLTIFGALGKRGDHTAYNLQLLSRYPKNVRIETEYEMIYTLNGPTEIACIPGQTISFIPIGATVTGVTTKGLKWELNNATFDKNFMSVSNICLEYSVHISFNTGDLLCFQEKIIN